MMERKENMELEKLLEARLAKELAIIQKLLEAEEKKPHVNICKLCPVCCLSEGGVLEKRTAELRENILRNRDVLEKVVELLDGLIKAGPDEMVVLVPIVVKRPMFEQDVLDIARGGIVLDKKALKVLDKYIF
ncbi:hypothetical protein [Persephonella sp.]